MRSGRAGLLAVLVGLVTGGVAAVVAAPSVRAAQGGLDGLADAVTARALPSLADARGLDVAVRVEAGAQASAAAAGTLGELIAARLGKSAGARVVDVWRGDAGRGPIEEGARRAGYERLVALTLEAEGARARVRGAVIALEGGPWVARTETRAQLWAAAPLDDELRALLAANGGTPSGPSGPSGPVAPDGPGPVRVRTIAVADLGEVVAASARAGRIAVATPRELVLFELRGERAVERARVALDGEWGASPPRAAVGAVRLQPTPEGEALLVEVRSSLFVDGARWRVDAGGAGRAPTGRVRGFPLDGIEGACELVGGFDWFTPSGCGRAAGALPDRFWSAAELVRRDGTRAEAAIVPATADRAARLWVRDRGAAPVEVAGVGAQLALGTLPRGEVVATAEGVDGAGPDAITLRALAPGLPVVHRLERPGAVRALALGDVDGDGRAEVVAVVRDAAQRRTELVVIQ